MAVTRFEDLVVWQKAKTLCVGVYRAMAEGRFARDFGLRDQVQRAAVSVMSNIAEGFERRSSADFARFLTIACGSAAEVKSQIYLAEELGYLGERDAAALRGQCAEVSRMLVSLRKSLRP